MKRKALWKLDDNEKIRVGVSSCLIGNPVRYNGGHKHDRRITDSLGKLFDFHPVCPETSAGLGIPRPTIRLVESGNGLVVRGAKKPDLDVTLDPPLPATPDGLYDRLRFEDCSDSPPPATVPAACNAVRTRAIVKALCASTLGSAAMLVQ